MGSGFLTYAEAANRLGRSKRSIHNYVKLGYLKSIVQAGSKVVFEEDVGQLAIETGVGQPAMNRKSFFQMQCRIQKLENEMTAVKHILEIRDEPLRPPDAEIRTLHMASMAYLAVGKWDAVTIDSWAGLFERMDEGFLEKLVVVTQDSKAWVPIFDFCLKLMEFSNNQVPNSLEWQARFKKLDEGRKRLRGTIILWTEMGRGTASEAILSTLDSPKEGLLRRLSSS